MKIVNDTLVFGLNSNYQRSETGDVIYGTKYWRRQKNTKRGALALAIVGGASTLTGIVGQIIDRSTNNNYTSESTRHWNIPLFAGLGLGAASVPLFIYAKNVKQKAEQPIYENTKYWKRHSSFNSCALVTLSVGIATAGFGWVGKTFGFGESNYSYSRENVYRTLYYVGNILVASSVPLFILSYKNKYKAKESVLGVSIIATAIPAVTSCGQMQTQPACGVSINF